MDKVSTIMATMLGLCLGLVLPLGNADAQQKQRVTYKSPAANTKYTQQHAIDVGDVPGHQVRVFEIHRTFPAEAPMINGVKLVETWSRTMSDYVDGNGPATSYTVYVMANGDKFFVRTILVAQSDGSGKLNTTNVGTITGGTGKFLGIRGILRATNLAEPKAGINEAQNEIEYWIEK
jgi:hypothetical protein